MKSPYDSQIIVTRKEVTVSSVGASRFASREAESARDRPCFRPDFGVRHVVIIGVSMLSEEVINVQVTLGGEGSTVQRCTEGRTGR
jgi:hypothetical protein